LISPVFIGLPRAKLGFSWGRTAFLAVALAGLAGAEAHDLRHGDIHIGHAWAKPAAVGGTAEVYFAAVNRGVRADGLVGARTPVAARAALAETQGEAVAPRPSLELAPSRPVALRPGRLHVRLEGLAQDLRVGDRFPLTLVFAIAAPAEVTVIVEEASGH
jgi:periplasmic copper chaperone A